MVKKHISTPNRDYIHWIYSKIDSPQHNLSVRNYSKLLEYLHDAEFEAMCPMDLNRFVDGADLRKAFSYESTGRVIGDELRGEGCSILEMLVALAIRCEDDIMGDPELGNRTPNWFWGMINSLGLIPSDNNHFFEKGVYTILDKFLTRQYRHDGHGGLFTLPGCPVNLTTVDIWEQMAWYLDRILDREA